MLVWYEGDNIGIKFSERPAVCMQYPQPGMTTAEKAEAEKFPFKNHKQISENLRILFKSNGSKGQFQMVQKRYTEINGYKNII